MADRTYDLGPLLNGPWWQYSDPVGMSYYYNTVTQAKSYSIPAGWEDAAGDQWVRDATKTWPQWNNQRTGRALLDDPNPPPPATYLEDEVVKLRITNLQRNDDSPERLWRRMMDAILKWLFTKDEGFSVLQKDMARDLHPDFTVFKMLTRPGGSSYEYEYLLGETKKPGLSFDSFADHLHTVCAGIDNDTKNCYGMLQVGFKIQIFKHENNHFEAISNRLHLTNDVHDVIAWARYLKDHPMPVVYK